MKRLFELDAARSDAELGIGSLRKGLETTALDGTTMELFRSDVLADAFGVPADGARPLLRAVAHVRTARAAALAGTDPRLIPFTAVLGLIRGHVTADTCCRHCGHRPARPDDPLAGLLAAILAQPRHRPGRQRTSGRTTAERRKRHTEEVGYTIDITKSNLPQSDRTPKSQGQWGRGWSKRTGGPVQSR